MPNNDLRQLNFRIDKKLYEWLKVLADKEGRSVTSQLNKILEEKANATS